MSDIHSSLSHGLSAMPTADASQLPPARFETLNADILIQVCLSLRSTEAYGRMSSTCVSWRQALCAVPNLEMYMNTMREQISVHFPGTDLVPPLLHPQHTLRALHNVASCTNYAAFVMEEPPPCVNANRLSCFRFTVVAHGYRASFGCLSADRSFTLRSPPGIPPATGLDMINPGVRPSLQLFVTSLNAHLNPVLLHEALNPPEEMDGDDSDDEDEEEDEDEEGEWLTFPKMCLPYAHGGPIDYGDHAVYPRVPSLKIRVKTYEVGFNDLRSELHLKFSLGPHPDDEEEAEMPCGLGSEEMSDEELLSYLEGRPVTEPVD